MVKSIKNKQIQSEKDAQNQNQSEKPGQQHSLNQVMEQMEQMKISSEGKNVSGGRATDSSTDGLGGAILKEESIPSATHYYSPAPGPVSALVQPIHAGIPQNFSPKRKSAKVTKLIKKTKISRNKKRSTQQVSSTSQSRPPRKLNHRKYTVKKCSNFIRKTLKKNGFKGFTKLQGGCEGAQGDRNRRGSTIYLPVGLLILRTILKESFKAFVQDYLNNLKNLQEVEERKFKANRNEKSENYIIEFKRARESVQLFCQGKEQQCIEKFFGAHEESYKEKTYLKESIEFYNQWRKELEVEDLQDFDTEAVQEREAQPEVEIMQIETPVNAYNQDSEEVLFSCVEWLKKN